VIYRSSVQHRLVALLALRAAGALLQQLRSGCKAWMSSPAGMDDAGPGSSEYDGLLPKRSRAGGRAGSCPLPVLKLALLGCFLTTCLVASRYFNIEKLELLLEHIKADPTGSFYVFLVCFILGIVLMLPGMVLSVGAGAVYGFALGSIITWLATVAGQTLAFLLGRYLLRDFVVAYLLKRVPNFGVIEEAMSREGWKLVCLLRLSPLVGGARLPAAAAAAAADAADAAAWIVARRGTWAAPCPAPAPQATCPPGGRAAAPSLPSNPPPAFPSRCRTTCSTTRCPSPR
jgi:uncharacterized membrane protein YdjX (TVP38/TMEM64 family)